jgi:peptidoglycan/xylan/chitin deacetylase (PgdA/CDA1 family)
MYLKLSKYLFLLTVTLSTSLVVFAKDSGVINYVDTNQKKVALTFDADMSPYMLQELKSGKVTSWYNQDVINELEKEQVPATLFLTGMWIERYSTTTKDLANNPLFEIGNHSYSHPAFSNHCYKLKPIKEAGDELQVSKTNELLDKYSPNHKMYFRFPGLCYDPDDLRVVNGQNYTVIGGDVYGGDGFQNSTKKIVFNVVRNVKPGSIVVLHMIGGPNAPKTSAALPTIIKKLKEKGYAFVKVSDLLSTTTISSTPSLLETILHLFNK